jgi:hypothetical protein
MGISMTDIIVYTVHGFDVSYGEEILWGTYTSLESAKQAAANIYDNSDAITWARMYVHNANYENEWTGVHTYPDGRRDEWRIRQSRLLGEVDV